jgi:AraC-like DNA-binding protein
MGTGSPMEYVRDVRLRRTHEELCDADPFADSVAAVARRWGFTSADSPPRTRRNSARSRCVRFADSRFRVSDNSADTTVSLASVRFNGVGPAGKQNQEWRPLSTYATCT